MLMLPLVITKTKIKSKTKLGYKRSTTSMLPRMQTQESRHVKLAKKATEKVQF